MPFPSTSRSEPILFLKIGAGIGYEKETTFMGGGELAHPKTNKHKHIVRKSHTHTKKSLTMASLTKSYTVFDGIERQTCRHTEARLDSVAINNGHIWCELQQIPIISL